MNNGITPNAIRDQVGRIVACEGFVRSPRMQRFLTFVVEEALAGRADQLGEYAVGLAVFDRGSDFEPAVDPIVRNDARRLRLKLLEYYRRAGSQGSEQVLIEIPKGGYVPVFLPMGSPEGGPRVGQPRLAVLPFEVLSDSPETVHDSRVLCLSLTANLTSLDGVDAVAHVYVNERSVRETAAELHLTHLIQGAVLKTGERCRIIINLIHVPQGTQLWAHEYEFDSSEMPAVQSQISANVLDVVCTRINTQHAPSQLSRVGLTALAGGQLLPMAA